MTRDILVIIPSLNEEKTIGDVISGIKKELKDCDVLVIDGYSQDDTVGVSLSHGAEVIQVAKEFGIAAAVEAGILAAYRGKYKYLIRIDADGQHPPGEIKKVLAHVISDEADFVVGSRFAGNTDHNSTFSWNMSIRAVSFLLKALYHVKITDCTSGCQVYNYKVIEHFATDKDFEYSEIRAIWTAKRAGFRIKEEFITVAQRTSGTSSFSAVKALMYMFNNIVDLVLSIPFSLNRI